MQIELLGRFHFNPSQKGQWPLSGAAGSSWSVKVWHSCSPSMPILRQAKPGICFITRTPGFRIKWQLDLFSKLIFHGTCPWAADSRRDVHSSQICLGCKRGSDLQLEELPNRCKRLDVASAGQAPATEENAKEPDLGTSSMPSEQLHQPFCKATSARVVPQIVINHVPLIYRNLTKRLVQSTWNTIPQ